MSSKIIVSQRENVEEWMMDRVYDDVPHASVAAFVRECMTSSSYTLSLVFAFAERVLQQPTPRTISLAAAYVRSGSFL